MLKCERDGFLTEKFRFLNHLLNFESVKEERGGATVEMKP